MLTIDKLSETQSGELIKNLLKGVALPVPIEKLINKRTGGNPFFIEEILRSFIDDGIIQTNNDMFIITESIHQVNIPETIQDVIISRVGKLDKKTKDLLDTASVMGRNFYFSVLEQTADTIEEVGERLEYLKQMN